jgi:DNA-binding CsgD family transcriptional regulator
MDYDDDRYATQRSRYLAKTTELRKPEAKAVAYTERGYSFDGVAKQMDTSESTVKDYMQRAMALYGLEITETLLPDEEPPDYDDEEVEPGYHESLSEYEREKWVKFVTRHQDKLPQEWAHDVVEAARADGVPVDT